MVSVYTPHVTAIEYQVDIPEEKFALITQSWSREQEFLQKLISAGAYRVDYNGHYGPHIMFCLTKYSYENSVHNTVIQLINDYLESL